MKLNIYDVYVADICTLISIEDKGIDEVTYQGKFIRASLVLKKYDRLDNIYYIDLMSGHKIKSNIGDCKIGEEYINYKLFYESVVNYIDETKISDKKISKSKILKLFKK